MPKHNVPSNESYAGFALRQASEYLPGFKTMTRVIGLSSNQTPTQKTPAETLGEFSRELTRLANQEWGSSKKYFPENSLEKYPLIGDAANATAGKVDQLVDDFMGTKVDAAEEYLEELEGDLESPSDEASASSPQAEADADAASADAGTDDVSEVDDDTLLCVLTLQAIDAMNILVKKTKKIEKLTTQYDTDPVTARASLEKVLNSYKETEERILRLIPVFANEYDFSEDTNPVDLDKIEKGLPGVWQRILEDVPEGCHADKPAVASRARVAIGK